MSNPTPGFTPAGTGGNTTQPPKNPAQKKSRVYVIVAVILGLLGGLGFLLGTTEVNNNRYVLRAKEPIAAQSVLTSEMVEAVALPLESIEEGAYSGATAEEAIAKLDFTKNPRAQFPIRKKGQIGEDSLRFDARLAVDLRPDERLISVEASVGSAIAGQIRPGDLVDIFVVMNGGDIGTVASQAYAAAEVVAVDIPEAQLQSAINRQAAAAESDGSAPSRDELLPGDPIPGIYTLKVRLEAVNRLILMEHEGSLYLAYRGPDAVDNADIDAWNPTMSACDAPFTPEEGQTPAADTACSRVRSANGIG